jgi:hypothetical protein
VRKDRMRDVSDFCLSRIGQQEPTKLAFNLNRSDVRQSAFSHVGRTQTLRAASTVRRVE